MAVNSSIGDLVWEDLNVDGIQDAGEPGIAGVTVNLYNCNGDLIDTTTTDAAGYYNFMAGQGDYFIEFEAPVEYYFTYQDQGTDDAEDSDADPATGLTTCIALDPEEFDMTLDAGMYHQFASIGDFVWEDFDADGIQNSDEAGISNVSVELYDCNGNLLATTVTDANGTYQFIGLETGNYSLGFILPDGYVFSPQDQGADDTKDSDADPATGLTTCITLDPGEFDMTLDTGIFEVMPDIDVEKYTNGFDKDTDTLPGIAIGDVVTWKYVVTNTGNVPLDNIVLTDNKQGIIPCPKNTLTPGESMECEIVSVAEYGHYANTANVTAQFDVFLVNDEDVGEYYGYEPGDGDWEPNAVPSAGPVITAVVLGIFMVLLLKKDQKQ